MSLHNSIKQLKERLISLLMIHDRIQTDEDRECYLIQWKAWVKEYFEVLTKAMNRPRPM
jgi:hypothetical protein